MEVFLDCLPCLLRQALEAGRMATDDEAVRHRIMEEALGVLHRYPAFPNSPAIARETHHIVQTHTGNADPYIAVKQRDLQMALQLLPGIERQMNEKEDRLYWALKASATGNVLDSALYTQHDSSRFDAEYAAPFAVCDIAALQQKLQTAKTLLIVGDNTGETAFDVLLLKQFPHLQCTYAVRSAPVINDATAAEAIASGIAPYAEILSTGSDSPGVQLTDCSDAFAERFRTADIVISKGQGNYETLSDSPRDLFFLLKAKCPVIARVLGVPLNSYVLRYKA